MGDATSKDDRAAGADTTSAELARSNARLQVLAEASRALAAVATDYDRLLDRIARMTADLIGDGCMVTLIGPDKVSLANKASAHRDPALQADYREFLAGMDVSTLTSASVSATVARTGQAKLVSDILPDVLVASTDDRLKPLVRRLNVHSFAVVPIHVGQAVIGTLSMLRSGPGRGYSSEDLTLLQDLADRGGLAIENARLYQQLEQRVVERTAELEAVNRELGTVNGQLAAANKELAVANEELEAFSYSVAHDLRAPVRSIEGFTGALQADFGDSLNEAGRDYLDRVQKAGERMSSLIDDLLGLARVSRANLRRKPIDLSALARKVVAEIAAREPSHKVESHVAEGLSAHADAGLVTVVLENLVGNAWKFTGGKDHPRIEIGQLQRDHAQVFFVRDNGAGFDMKNADKLFGPFQRLHGQSEFPGTGIGLATVHRIIARHEGRLWAEAESDRGATFFFTLQGEAISPG